MLYTYHAGNDSCAFSDVIMDILGNKGMRKMVTDYYEDTGEHKLVSKAIAKAWIKERGFSESSMDFTGKYDLWRYVCNVHTAFMHNHVRIIMVHKHPTYEGVLVPHLQAAGDSSLNLIAV